MLLQDNIFSLFIPASRGLGKYPFCAPRRRSWLCVACAKRDPTNGDCLKKCIARPTKIATLLAYKRNHFRVILFTCVHANLWSVKIFLGPHLFVCLPKSLVWIRHWKTPCFATLHLLFTKLAAVIKEICAKHFPNVEAGSSLLGPIRWSLQSFIVCRKSVCKFIKNNF